jgi:hypothetical protein
MVDSLSQGHRRQVEVSLAQPNPTMQLDVLHGQTGSGALKELTAFAMAYNLVRMVIWHTATLRHIAVERISVLDALRRLGAPSTGMPLAALIVNSIRPHRVESRVKKRRPKRCPLRCKPRQQLRPQLLPSELSSSLLPFGYAPLCATVSSQGDTRRKIGQNAL